MPHISLLYLQIVNRDVCALLIFAIESDIILRIHQQVHTAKLPDAVILESKYEEGGTYSTFRYQGDMQPPISRQSTYQPFTST